MKKILYLIDRIVYGYTESYYCSRCKAGKTAIWTFGCHGKPKCQTAPLELGTPFRRWLFRRFGLLLA